jgi:hypothetical protein
MRKHFVVFVGAIAARYKSTSINADAASVVSHHTRRNMSYEKSKGMSL